ncbi:hypothetical protein Tco_0417144 [Tanacetum coccineum]
MDEVIDDQSSIRLSDPRYELGVMKFLDFAYRDKDRYIVRRNFYGSAIDIGQNEESEQSDPGESQANNNDLVRISHPKSSTVKVIHLFPRFSHSMPRATAIRRYSAHWPQPFWLLQYSETHAPVHVSSERHDLSIRRVTEEMSKGGGNQGIGDNLDAFCDNGFSIGLGIELNTEKQAMFGITSVARQFSSGAIIADLHHVSKIRTVNLRSEMVQTLNGKATIAETCELETFYSRQNRDMVDQNCHPRKRGIDVPSLISMEAMRTPSFADLMHSSYQLHYLHLYRTTYADCLSLYMVRYLTN